MSCGPASPSSGHRQPTRSPRTPILPCLVAPRPAVRLDGNGPSLWAAVSSRSSPSMAGTVQRCTSRVHARTLTARAWGSRAGGSRSTAAERMRVVGSSLFTRRSKTLTARDRARAFESPRRFANPAQGTGSDGSSTTLVGSRLLPRLSSVGPVACEPAVERRLGDRRRDPEEEHCDLGSTGNRPPSAALSYTLYPWVHRVLSPPSVASIAGLNETVARSPRRRHSLYRARVCSASSTSIAGSMPVFGRSSSRGPRSRQRFQDSLRSSRRVSTAALRWISVSSR
jgi:hypothetical protein